MEWKPLPPGIEKLSADEWIDFYRKENMNTFSNFLVTVKYRYSNDGQWIYNVDVGGCDSNFHFWTINDWDEGQEIYYTHWARMPAPCAGLTS